MGVCIHFMVVLSFLKSGVILLYGTELGVGYEFPW